MSVVQQFWIVFLFRIFSKNLSHTHTLTLTTHKQTQQTQTHTHTHIHNTSTLTHTRTHNTQADTTDRHIHTITDLWKMDEQSITIVQSNYRRLRTLVRIPFLLKDYLKDKIKKLKKRTLKRFSKIDQTCAVGIYVIKWLPKLSIDVQTKFVSEHSET